MTRIATGTPRPTVGEDEDRPRGLRGGFRGGISNLRLTKDGRTLFFQEGESVYNARGGGGGGGGGGGFAAMAALAAAVAAVARGVGGGGGDSAGAAGGGGGGAKRRITFNVTVRIDKPQEWDEMFDDAWRCMKYRFYDPKLHGTDWDAMRAKYKPLVAYVADRHELMNVINEMIGELNASHTGASAGREPDRRRGRGGARHDPAPRPRPPGGPGQRPLQGHARLRRRAGRQRLDQGRKGELPDRHRRQAGQGRRRLQRVPGPPAQSQGRADLQ